MIEGYGADFTTVYTVLKHAQKVGDVWNRMMQESRLMWPSASKENKFKRSVPKNIQTPWFVWHGRLHIALKYMSMLCKKFRFYVSDLKNISVYGLVRYINIFLKIFCHLTFPAPPRSPVPKIIRHHQRFEWETTERN